MKAISTAVTAALFVISASVCCFAVEGAMKGVDPTYRGGVTGVTHGGTGGGAKAKAAGANASCSSSVARCKKNFPDSAAACASAGESCMQSGTFTNPKGQSFTGLKQQ